MKEQTAVELLFLMLNNLNKDQEFSKKLLDKVKKIEKQAEERFLFIGKVSQIIGFDKTAELLKEVEQEMKHGI
jgi:fumarate hydratase class II